MSHTTRKRRTFSWLLTAALVLAQVAAYVALPRPAAAALSADPNAEIVYIDDDGFIRVLDTQGDPLVEWVSPDGGWNQIVLLDINNDEDMEILALDKQGDENLRVTVFDPVVSFGSTDPSKQINGIPWDILFTTTFSGEGKYVAAGDFDTAIPGDEFVVGFRHGTTSLVQIYNANSLDGSGNPTGRDMKVHIQKEYPNQEYGYGISGQLNGDGSDELILFDSQSAKTRMDIYRTDQDMFRTDNDSSDGDKFKYGATGQLVEDGREELVAIIGVRGFSNPSLRAYIMDDEGQIEIDELWVFNPQPEWVFLADIRGNGDEEIVFLRNYPDGQDGPRLIMRDDWGDDKQQNKDLIEWSLMEGGAKNEFRGGVGADIDGDGRDEIIIQRDDRIRIYHRPETGSEGSSNYNDYFVATDDSRINLIAGDLDRNGFTTGPILVVSGNMIDAIVPAGTVSQDFFVSVDNVGTDGNVGINAIVPGGNAWAEVNPIFASTPANFRIRLNATSLNPGTYNTTMTLRTNLANVVNDNYVVYLNLTVIPPVLEPNPPILDMYRFPCASDPCSGQELAERNAPFTSTLRIDGSTSLAFRAAILGVPNSDGSAVTAAVLGGLTGPITGGALDENGNIVISDDFGNSRTLASAQVSSADQVSNTIMVDPSLTWVTTATLDSNIVPANIALGIDPTVLTEEFQREYAVLILVADTRAGTPNGNVTLVPIQLANIGDLLWVSILKKN